MAPVSKYQNAINCQPYSLLPALLFGNVRFDLIRQLLRVSHDGAVGGLEVHS